jgi:long-chain acyl-CoA synthetase
VSAYAARPWLSLYREGAGADLTPEHGDALSMFRASAAATPGSPALRYFDGTLTFGELDAASDAFAAALLARGFQRGERVALYLQNVPQFVLALVGTWKAGGIAVLINPMSRERELSYQLDDSGAAVLVCLESLYGEVARHVSTGVRLTLTTSELEYQTRHDPRLFEAARQVRHEGTEDLGELIAEYAGQAPPAVTPRPGDVAFLTYTSGTTGTPKGAMNTHANVAFTAQVYRDWMDLGGGDVVLGVAPLFHITGAIGHVAVSLLTGIPLVLTYRFDPGVVRDAIREHRPTFTVGAITVFIALLNAPGGSRSDWESFRSVYSGGAPISPATNQAFEEATGCYIHNIYGLTETTSPSHAVPLGATAPVDPASGALSVGVPVPGTVVRILAEEGTELPPGEVGEIVTRGPQVVAGYWGKPDETAHAIRDGWLHTGDVGFMDPAGWFYLVDRKKDLINAAGYKVWPREVEDVLYEHPAVREAAVIGVPDPYRGETVKAFVSLREGGSATPDELIAFAKERMAAYKYPRSLEIVDELPKTVTGKILRRALRNPR